MVWVRRFHSTSPPPPRALPRLPAALAAATLPLPLWNASEDAGRAAFKTPVTDNVFAEAKRVQDSLRGHVDLAVYTVSVLARMVAARRLVDTVNCESLPTGGCA
jgi:hypothetical protein